jgi:hypothetical protein
MKPISRTPAQISRTTNPKYPYTFAKEWVVDTGKECGNHYFRDAEGRVWLSFRGRLMTISAGYSWDGASCAPDFPAVLAASGAHDALIQFRHVPCFPLTKHEIDRVFRGLMSRNFIPRWIYWAAVRVFGGIYAGLAPSPKSASCGLTHRR